MCQVDREVLNGSAASHVERNGRAETRARDVTAKTRKDIERLRAVVPVLHLRGENDGRAPCGTAPAPTSSAAAKSAETCARTSTAARTLGYGWRQVLDQPKTDRLGRRMGNRRSMVVLLLAR